MDLAAIKADEDSLVQSSSGNMPEPSGDGASETSGKYK